jgi:hypothetical protein
MRPLLIVLLCLFCLPSRSAVLVRATAKVYKCAGLLLGAQEIINEPGDLTFNVRTYSEIWDALVTAGVPYQRVKLIESELAQGLEIVEPTGILSTLAKNLHADRDDPTKLIICVAADCMANQPGWEVFSPSKYKVVSFSRGITVLGKDEQLPMTVIIGRKNDNHVKEWVAYFIYRAESLSFLRLLDKWFDANILLRWTGPSTDPYFNEFVQDGTNKYELDAGFFYLVMAGLKNYAELVYRRHAVAAKEQDAFAQAFSEQAYLKLLRMARVAEPIMQKHRITSGQRLFEYSLDAIKTMEKTIKEAVR